MIMNVWFDFSQEIVADAVIGRYRFAVAQIGVAFIGQILAFFICRIITEIREVLLAAIQILQQLVDFVGAQFKFL